MAYDITNYQEKLIGTGLQVPDSFDKTSGKVNYNTGKDRINQSISHILGTRIGERFFLPEFGSRLHELLFEPNDYILNDLLVVYITDALNKWEPRIQVLSVKPDVSKGNIVPVYIKYNLINTNIVENYVYPFNRSSYELGQVISEED